MEEQQQNLEIILEESRSHTVPLSKEEIHSKLQQLKMEAKKEMNQEIENQFVDLLGAATQYYGDEMAFELAQFYYEYGTALLNKLVNNTDDIFGDLLKKQQKKEDNGEQQEEQDDDDVEQAEEEQQQKQEIKQEIKQESQNQQQQENKEQVQQQKSENVVFKDNEVEIVDENQPEKQNLNQEEEETKEDINNMENGKEKEKEKEEDADDMQISYENLYTALTIGKKDFEDVKRSYSDDQIKQDPQLRQKVTFLADCCNRLGEFENWREKFDDAIEYFGKAHDYLLLVLKPNSREIATNKFMQGNTILYKEKSDETHALQYFIECIQILENILSNQCSLPIKEFPSAENIKKENLEVEHLKETFLDSQETKELKQTIKQLYEKIEDTILQRDQKIEFEREQQKMKQQQDQANQFQPVDPTKVQIKNLGVIGNAKKRDPNGVKKITFAFAPANNNSAQNKCQNSQENQENNQNSNNLNQNKSLLAQPSPALQQQDQQQQQEQRI